MLRVPVKPELLRWAIARVGGRSSFLYRKFPKLKSWEQGESHPTLKQLEAFANAAYVPVGCLFLDGPPDEPMPITDLRTHGSRGVAKPSPNLLDVVYLCQQRQEWFREHAESNGETECDFIGSARINHSPEGVAATMRRRLGFESTDRRGCDTWESALREFVEKIEAIGVLVMVSGVVGSNTRRVLDPTEFRGFSLSDPFAPLIFVNGADAKAAQMFTLAHELAHLWLGQSALSDAAMEPDNRIEAWCNQVAAELLVPRDELQDELGDDHPLDAVPRISRALKVSQLVVLRRLLDCRLLTRDQFEVAYAAEVTKYESRKRSGGGDFYLTQGVRLSKRFARAIIASTLEGHTLFRDAYHLLGIRREATLRELGRTLEALS